MDNDLREAAACGDHKKVSEILERDVSLMNHPHSVNGWTALHWAAKRNQTPVVQLLVNLGADKCAKTSDGRAALDLATDTTVRQLLDGGDDTSAPMSDTPADDQFVPSYMKYPQYPSYHKSINKASTAADRERSLASVQPPASTVLQSIGVTGDEVVLKARLADREDKDFIEIELEKSARRMENLIQLLSDELDIDKADVVKVRKLPNTILRKDKDVTRLVDFQEIEVVCKKGSIGPKLEAAASPTSKNTGSLLY